MIRSALLAVFALSGFSAVDASAAEVRVAYRGVVFQAGGEQAASFAAGQQVSASYVVETTTADSDPRASAGIFYDGLRELHISIADTGVDVTTGAGVVQTFNDHFNGLYNMDKAYFDSSNQVSGELAGLPINYAEVNFEDNQQAMLSSDVIPTSHLLGVQSTIYFRTSKGWTYVLFLAEADESAESCASEGYKGAQLTWCKNICENGLTGKTLDTWIHRWTNRYRQLPYCAVDGPSNPT